MVSQQAPAVVVATHGHCFDGMCSAALFTRLARARISPAATFRYFACGYGPEPGGVSPAILSGDENAILDFRYTKSPKLTWYFDHHATAFATPDERGDFDSNDGKQKFYDPHYGSCTKLIYDVSRDHFGLADTPAIVELVRWADIIDAARFASAEMAVVRADPALWLMTVVENHGDEAFLAKFVPRLLAEPLEDIARSAEIQSKWTPLRDAHLTFVDKVRAKSEARDKVVFVDLTESVIDVVGKFVTYALFPTSVYSVMVSRGKTRCKVSVGYNPWSGSARQHDISQICQRYGGGGHAVVGAIALGPSEIERARNIGLEITAELNS
ncbi:MAG TPA: hypothetical protein VK550_36500 [Polyangiaceae bacterium]|nr:hypothetical protein [Polyangiaceae bacterium]